MRYTFYIAPSGSFDISNGKYYCVRSFQKEDDETPYTLIYFYGTNNELLDEIQDWIVEDLGFDRCKNPVAFRLNTDRLLTPKEFIQFAKLFYEVLKNEFNLDIEMAG